MRGTISASNYRTNNLATLEKQVNIVVCEFCGAHEDPWIDSRDKFLSTLMQIENHANQIYSSFFSQVETRKYCKSDLFRKISIWFFLGLL